MALKEIAGPQADWSVLRRSGLLCKTLFWIWNFRGHFTENHRRQIPFHSIRFVSIRFDSILFDLIRSGLVEPSVCALCIADSKKSDKPKRPKSMKQTAVRQVSNIIQIQMEFSYQPFFRHFLCMTEPNQHNIGNDLLNWLCHTYTYHQKVTYAKRIKSNLANYVKLIWGNISSRMGTIWKSFSCF